MSNQLKQVGVVCARFNPEEPLGPLLEEAMEEIEDLLAKHSDRFIMIDRFIFEKPKESKIEPLY